MTTRPELFEHEGIFLTHCFADNWENVQKFQARPDDILIATYPKAGTTWISYILDLLYFGSTEQERQTSIPIYMRVPFLESNFHKIPTGVVLANNLPTTPRLIKTHLSFQLVPKSFWEQNCKVVYVARNAKDNVVSCFHFERTNQSQPEPGDWNDCIQNFMDGKRTNMADALPTSPCIIKTHLPVQFVPKFFWEQNCKIVAHNSKDNVVFYFHFDRMEKGQPEPGDWSSFLQRFKEGKKERKKIVACVQFDVMKANPMTNLNDDPTLDSVSQFLRK
ncbi:cytosolic sulfotransferase 3-like, partial [Clarias magur]